MEKPRGRPPHGPTDRINIQSWVCEVGRRAGVKTTYGLEKYYKLQTGVISKNEPFMCANLFEANRKNFCFPPNAAVDYFEEIFPGTKNYLVSPFWKLLKNPYMTEDQLFPLLDQYPFRFRMNIALPRRLTKFINKESNLDALALCLWILSESSGHLLSNSGKFRKSASDLAITIFFRIAAEAAFEESAEQLFFHIKDSIRHSFLTTSSTKYLDEINFEEKRSRNVFILTLINELNLLRTYKTAPSSCLYIAEKYFTDSLIEEFKNNFQSKLFHKTKQHPSIKKLSRGLKRWESEKSAEDSILNKNPDPQLDGESFYIGDSLVFENARRISLSPQ